MASVLTIFAAAACSGGSQTATTATSSSPGTVTALAVTSTLPGGDASHPVGLLAIGHSELTGENTDPNQPHRPVLRNSWATGTSPEVLSVYQRLVEALPETQGHVSNRAKGGAPASALPEQAQAGLGDVPFPRLVIIQTIDNDILCNGSDPAHVPEVGQSIAATLKIITDQSPNSVILIMSQPGRPVDDIAAIAQDPVAKARQTGSGPCDAFNPAGDLVDANIVNLTAVIEGYENEQARVCATVPQCHTDDGAFASFKGYFADVSLDGNHLKVQGLARLAATAWPVVKQVLALP